MTKLPSIQSCLRSSKRSILAAGIALWLLLPGRLQAQTDTTAPAPAVADTTVAQPEEPPAPELVSPSLEFLAVQKGDMSIDLKARLKAKVKGSSMNLYRMRVKFFQVSGDQETELGSAVTDNAGKALFNVKGDSLKPDAEGKLQFKAVFAGNKLMETAEESFGFKRAKLEITPIKEDSLLSVKVRLVDLGTGTETPVKDVTVGIFVKRMFLPLKVGEGTTDENGEATVEFPSGLPGDAKGNLTLLAKLDENENFGYMESSVVQNWGKPVSDKIEDQPRALWSSHPPIWMLVTFIVLMLAVWGHYVVIVYELFRLRKEQPTLPTNATNN